MNFINVSDIFLDCDRDSIIYLGKPDGPTCHTGAETCYYTSVEEATNDPLVADDKLALTTLYSLVIVIIAETCYYTSVEEATNDPLVADDKLALTTLYSLVIVLNDQFDSVISETVSKLSKLKILKLEMNELSGDIHRQLGKLENLLIANVSHNMLVGRLPA